VSGILSASTYVTGAFAHGAAKAAPVEASVKAAACSAADQAAINAKGGGTASGSFPELTSECSKKSVNIFKGIDETKFNTCFEGDIAGVSEPCSDCFWQAAEYGFKHCKGACIANWCSSGCLECAAKFDAAGCAGFTAPAPTPC
jgi:hypothetical protein